LLSQPRRSTFLPAHNTFSLALDRLRCSNNLSFDDLISHYLLFFFSKTFPAVRLMGMHNASDVECQRGSSSLSATTASSAGSTLPENKGAHARLSHSHDNRTNTRIGGRCRKGGRKGGMCTPPARGASHSSHRVLPMIISSLYIIQPARPTDCPTVPSIMLTPQQNWISFTILHRNSVFILNDQPL